MSDPIDLRRWAAAVKNRDEHKCVVCGSEGLLDAHHIVPRSLDKKHACFVGNGVTLCQACHEKAHTQVVSQGLVDSRPNKKTAANIIMGKEAYEMRVAGFSWKKIKMVVEGKHNKKTAGVLFVMKAAKQYTSVAGIGWPILCYPVKCLRRSNRQWCDSLKRSR